MWRNSKVSRPDHIRTRLRRNSVPQVEPNSKRVAGTHRLAVLRGRTVVPGAGPCEFERGLIEPRLAARLDKGRIGSEAPMAVDARPDSRDTHFVQADGRTGIKIRRIRKPFSWFAEHAIDLDWGRRHIGPRHLSRHNLRVVPWRGFLLDRRQPVYWRTVDVYRAPIGRGRRWHIDGRKPLLDDLRLEARRNHLGEFGIQPDSKPAKYGRMQRRHQQKRGAAPRE